MKDIFDYPVYDRHSRKVGTVDNIWQNDEGDIGFIGISTGLMGLGRNHLIPADGVSIDTEARAVRVPYDEDLIKSSPSFGSNTDLDPDVEASTLAHYGVSGGRDYAPPATGHATDTGHTGTTAVHGEDVEVPLMKETLDVEKRRKKLGEVRLRKVVRTETVNKPVELQHEEVVVERVAEAGHHRPGHDTFTEKVATIPVSEEEAVVHKNVESAGTAKAHKVVESERKDVRDTVRKEDVKVERAYEGSRTRE
jgi:uncharacterized protein (TIGR02271 family)